MVRLNVHPRANDPTCAAHDEHAITEYWLVETGANDTASSIRLLVVDHYAPYAPQRGEIEGSETFVWSIDDPCYGAGPSCRPGRRSARIALSAPPHVVGAPLNEPVCPEAMPLMVSADW